MRIHICIVLNVPLIPIRDGTQNIDIDAGSFRLSLAITILLHTVLITLAGWADAWFIY